jgi:transcriptional regulator with XRE-family HTH domain
VPGDATADALLMGGRVKELDSGTSPRHHLGAEIRRAREEASMSQAQLAKITGHDRTYVTKVERGDIDPSDKFVEACDRAFPSRQGWFTRFWLDYHEWVHTYKPWFHGWVEKFERQAVILREWEPLLVPGPLQTRDYAHAILSSWRRHDGDTVEENLTARIDRQCIMDRSDPPDLRILLDESVLWREVGSASVTHAEFRHVLDMAGRPNVSVQVVPASARVYLGLAGAFAVATLTDGSQGAYLETGIRGMTVVDAELVAQAAQMFDDLRDEALSRSNSRGVIGEAAAEWERRMTAAGESPAIPTPTAATALRSVKSAGA